MMEQGQLVSAEVLPKVAAEFKKSAKEGGAYALALQGLRVKEGQFATGAQRAAKTIFNSGFESGLSNLYNTMSEIFENSEPQLKKLGKIFGDVFNAIARGLKILEPVMKIAIDNFYTLVGVKSLFMIRTFASVLNKQSYLAAAAWARMFAPLTAGIATIDELYSMMDDTKLGLLERQYGRQINLLEGTTSGFTERNGKFISTPNSKQSLALDILSPNKKEKSTGFFDNALDTINQGAKFSTMSSMLGSAPYVGGTVIYNNIFNNTQADDVKRNVDVNASVATQYRGK